MERLELTDVQGIITRGYEELEGASCMLVAVDDPQSARRWLGSVAGDIADGREQPLTQCVQLAFTSEGLRRLGLPAEILSQFSPEFRDGMATPERQHVLGDHGPSAPEHWRWGGPSTRQPHIAVLLFASDDAALRRFEAACAAEWEGIGALRVVCHLPSVRLPGRKEHFGFRDGIGQPVLAGVDAPGSWRNVIKTGEIVLGYTNEYGEYPSSPRLAARLDPDGLLLPDREDASMKDFGRNGSYMVFRQLQQDVVGFWRYLDRATRRPDGGSDPEARVRLAAKMVGRWPSGAPLAMSPERDDPRLADADEFSYRDLDPHGVRCPIGSHARRMNPRDALELDRSGKESLQLVKGRRIMRRPRSYGPPLAASMDPADLAAAPDDGLERGLHFICFQTNIRRQFEFIQQTWGNNEKFSRLYDEKDPIIGDRTPGDRGLFTVPASPVRQRLKGLPRFVQVRGGAYFFLPGKRAITFLSRLR